MIHAAVPPVQWLMMEVEAAADGAADLLMECDEEELEVWQSLDTEEEDVGEGED